MKIENEKLKSKLDERDMKILKLHQIIGEQQLEISKFK